MKKLMVLLLSIVLLFTAHLTTAEEEMTAEQKAYMAEAKKIWGSLDRQTGEIKLPEDIAILKVPESFYYLSPTDSEKILVDVWGNPPGAGLSSMGMLFPADSTPFDSSSWGVTIEYIEDGVVSDEDADEINYDKLLVDMQLDTKVASKQRMAEGYGEIELVGWASKPYYDKSEHKLHWAKEIKFGGQDVNTLNYNIRVLGRKGILVLNFIAGMDQKEVIDSQLNTVLAMAEFNAGSTYADFDPDLDNVAAYGIGALVAGKVIAKTGFLALALIFLKKFGIFILVGLGALFKQVFSKKNSSIIQ